jgi:hypothetical protein
VNLLRGPVKDVAAQGIVFAASDSCTEEGGIRRSLAAVSRIALKNEVIADMYEANATDLTIREIYSGRRAMRGNRFCRLLIGLDELESMHRC